jgi:hypothetical protein
MAERPANLPIPGGTGLVAHLYEYLWTKNNLLQTRCMYHRCPPVLIPDTILLKNKQPVAWYFSSLNTGTLQRRMKDLSVPKVREALLRRQDPALDVVCTYVGSAKGDVQPITEYLTPAGMDYFMSTPPSRRTKEGMLQTFIHPKGTSNFIIRVTWTQEGCSMDSCININNLVDEELEAQDRTATNDERNCVLIPMSGSVLATQLERLCACIAEHVHLASQQMYKVSTMIVNFKIDSEDRVWLLWCEQLEVTDDQGRLLRTQQAEQRNLDEVDLDGDAFNDEAPADATVAEGRKARSKQFGRADDEPEMVDEEEEEPRRQPRGRGEEHDEPDANDLILLPAGEKGERRRSSRGGSARRRDSRGRGRGESSTPRGRSGPPPPLSPY